MKRFFPIAVGALALALAALSPSRAPAAGRRQLDIYFVDTEGGAATLMVMPTGESVLVDSGWPREDGRDAKRIAHCARDVAGVTQIDHFVLTHWHTDHVGGIEALTHLMPVKHFYDHGVPETLAEDPQGFPLLRAAYERACGGHSTTLSPGDTIPLRPAALPLELKVLAARGKVIGEGDRELPISCDRHPAQPIDTSDNAKSLALLLSYGRFRFLNCGDLTWNIEHKLACPVNRVGKVDLWQVPHHGSELSSNPALVEAIQPRCAVNVCGARKGGDPQTFATLKRSPSLQGIYQLHLNVTSRPEDNVPLDHIANVEENCKGEFIRVRLNDDATRYTIYRGADHAWQTFRVQPS